jgi:hypothetical protein
MVKASAQHPERGLALLLVISLLALVTVLVVSLAVITRVETQINMGSSAQIQAKHNALLALSVAMGELQRQVGPDQRVTAAADAASASAVNPHWTGVWRTDGATVQPVWLVSGANADPTASLVVGRSVIELVGSDSGSLIEPNGVSVPVELIKRSGLSGFDGEQVTGAFAFFVADQGGKASVGPNRSEAVVANVDWTPYESRFAAERLPLMGGGTAVPFNSDETVELSGPDPQSRLNSLHSLEQLPIVTNTLTAARVKEHWHDYTAQSHALLADAARGNLKVDLTTKGATEIPGLAAYQDLMTDARSAGLSATYPIRPQSSGAGDVSDIIVPLVTQLGLHVSVNTISPTSRTLETRLRFFVELANPFSSALEAEDLRVVMSGLPGDIVIESRTSDTSEDPGGATINLRALYALQTDSSGSPAIEFDLPFEAEVWAPGRVYNWRLESPTAVSSPPNRTLVFDASSRTSFWRERPGVTLDGPDLPENSSEFRFTGNDDWDLVVELQRADGELLVRCVLPSFSAVDSGWVDASSTIPDFGVHVRLNDRIDAQDADEASNWIRVHGQRDLRRADFDESFWAPVIDFESASYGESFSSPNSAVESRQLFNRDPVDRSALSYYQPSYNSDVALFELPKQEWHSVGSLQHLAFPEEPIYNVGNAWSQRNDWFDRYFFSTLPELGQVSSVLPNQSIRRIPTGNPVTDAGLRAQPDTIAQSLWIEGGFNINSVRTEAWTTVLAGIARGGLPVNLSYTTHDSVSGDVTGEAVIELERPLARFAQSAGEMFEISPNLDNFQAVLRTYRQGVKPLTPEQISGLASQIATNVQERIRARGPFLSIEEFLAPDVTLFGGDNLLEYSISEYDSGVAEPARINWDQFFPGTPQKIDRAAPMYLTSADLMTGLAPMISVRSDTFVVRTYGEVVDPVLESEFGGSTPTARAWLEAVVQRFPEGVDATDFVQSDSEDWRQMIAEPRFGRRLRVVSFRWLTETDL